MFGKGGFSISVVGDKNDNERINGNSDSPLSSKNHNITITGNNNSSIDGKNGNISVMGNNSGEIDNKNGNISIGGNNNSSIYGKNGNISVMGDNSGEIDNKNGEVSVSGMNSSVISSKNGGIYVGLNKGELNTQVGSIDIGNVKIRVEKMSVSGTVNIVGGNVNSVIMSGSSNVTIINGEVWVNGVKQDGNTPNSIDSNDYKVFIDDIIIDYNNKTVSKNGNEVKILEDKSEPIRIVGDTIEIDYENQVVKVFEDYINIKGS